MTSEPAILQQPTTAHIERPRRRWSITEWLARWRERQALKDLSDATLQDIGLTRDDVTLEINRALWLR